MNVSLPSLGTSQFFPQAESHDAELYEELIRVIRSEFHKSQSSCRFDVYLSEVSRGKNINGYISYDIFWFFDNILHGTRNGRGDKNVYS